MMPETLSALVVFVVSTIVLMGSALSPAIMAGVGALCALALPMTIAVPGRWLIPWLLVSAVAPWAIYDFREKRSEDFAGDFILIAGIAPYVCGLLARIAIRAVDHLRTMSQGYSD